MAASFSAKANASTTTAGICMRGFRSGTTRMTTEEQANAATSAWIRCMPSRPAATKLPRDRQILISTAVLRRHLETMLRLDIEYDFLPRESEILHLKFWDWPLSS